MSLRILGFDPGSRKAGYAVIEVDGKKVRYIDSGVIHYDSDGDFIPRLHEIFKSGVEIVKKYSPDEIAIESLIYVKSVTSLAKLAQGRGAILTAFLENSKAQISEYSPNLVKSSVTGHGHAEKENVQKALRMIFGDKCFKTDDESDALAIALCHSLNRGKKELLERTKNSGKSMYSGGRSLKDVFTKRANIKEI